MSTAAAPVFVTSTQSGPPPMAWDSISLIRMSADAGAAADANPATRASAAKARADGRPAILMLRSYQSSATPRKRPETTKGRRWRPFDERSGGGTVKTPRLQSQPQPVLLPQLEHV